MNKKNILILFGGGGSEHEVSCVSASYIKEELSKCNEFNPILVEISKSGSWISKDRECSLNGKILKTPTEQPYIDYVIPCFHGKPGETGEIQGYLDTIGLPFLGQHSEAAVLTFNKVQTKLLLEKLGIPNTPWTFVNKYIGIDEDSVLSFFDMHLDVFVKASNQGSSVGCFHVKERSELISRINEAFNFSDNVLIEKTIKGRELEVAVFENNGKIVATAPGEILCTGDFYDYDQKYSKESTTEVEVLAKNLTEQQLKSLEDYSIKAFKAFGLRHLSRVDFFVSDNDIYLNEINTFPGMTPISMFPKMLENTGLKFSEYIKEIITNTLNK